MRYTARYLLSPEGYFGLPEDGYLVLPAQPGRQLMSGVLDLRTGTLTTHGSLPEYRKDAERLAVSDRSDTRTVSIVDNFLTIEQDGERPAQVLDEIGRFVDLLTQSLGLHLGHVVSARILGFFDDSGKHAAPPSFQWNLMKARLFNLGELSTFTATSLAWARTADVRAQKSLSYFESALILRDFGQNLAYGEYHGGFINRLSFLQLFKAIVVLVGEPKVDRDYQSRAKSLGLEPDFWNKRVKPYYLVRSDDDVAHHSVETGEGRSIESTFASALGTYREVLRAHFASTEARGV